MKKIIFLIAGLSYSLATMGQQVALNDGVSVSFPGGTQKITKEQALAHASKKFSNDKIVTNSITDRNTKYLYKVDDILLSLFVFDKPNKVKETHLLEAKKGFDAASERGDPSHYTSSLKKINGNSVLTLFDVVGQIGYYHFYCYNANNNRVITGILEFDKSDFDEASTILDNLLNSIKFKD